MSLIELVLHCKKNPRKFPAISVVAPGSTDIEEINLVRNFSAIVQIILCYNRDQSFVIFAIAGINLVYFKLKRSPAVTHPSTNIDYFT